MTGNTLKTKSDWCSIDFVLQIASAKWSIPILMNLVEGPRRPAELSRALTGINPKILTERLRNLEKWGMIDRQEYREIPPRVEYSLTERSWELLNALIPLKDLGKYWHKIDSAIQHIESECAYCLGKANFDKEHFRFANIEQATDYLEDESTPIITKAKVFLIGTGPGARDLITIRGAKALKQVSLVLYSGHWEPESILSYCSDTVQLINTDGLSLHEQKEQYLYAKENGLQIARLYAGDPTIFGYIAEQIESLEEIELDYEIIPGINAFTASAASIGCSLTQLRVAESVIITNVAARTSKQSPRNEDLAKVEELAKHQTTMCIYVWGAYIPETVFALSKYYPPETAVNLVCYPQQPNERIHISRLSSILDEINIKDWQATTMMLVGNTLPK